MHVYKEYCPSQLAVSSVKKFEDSNCKYILTGSLKAAAKHQMSEPVQHLENQSKNTHNIAKKDIISGILGDIAINGAKAAINDGVVADAVNGILNGNGQVTAGDKASNVASSSTNSCGMQCLLSALKVVTNPEAIVDGLCSKGINFDSNYAQTSSALTTCASSCDQQDVAVIINDACAGGRLLSAVVDGGKLLSNLLGLLARRDEGSASEAQKMSVESVFEIAFIFSLVLFF
ncbi:UNVERIFIED_CONTAM: hypothetical protein HDU68_004557 [Siphonaria sp. JEL0065]|nr:hypothetical protein HDU68_004557 [Siphonaria sp. JEL0065]